MDYKQLIKQIRLEQINRFYLFKGEEPYLMDHTLKQFIDLIPENGRDFNLRVIDAEDASIANLESILETVPMFSDKKLVILRDVVECNEASKEDFFKGLAEIIPSIPSDTVLIAVDRRNKLDKRSKLYKQAKSDASLIDFPRADEKELERWLLRKITEAGKNIRPKTLTALSRMSGYHDYESTVQLYELDNELKKLLEFSGEEITEDDLHAVLSSNFDENIFKFLNEAFSGKKEMFLTLQELELANVPIQRTWHMVLRQARLLLEISLLRSADYSDTSIREQLKISPYELKRLSETVRKKSTREWKELFRRAERIDFLQKSGTLHLRYELECFLSSLLS